MRKYVSVVLCVVTVLLIACQQKAPTGRMTTTRGQPSDVRNAKVSEVIQPAPRFVDRALLGSEVGQDGMVSKESASFTRGEPIYLTMVFRESPPGLQTSAVWMGTDKKPLRTERKVMNGGKVATFGFQDPKLKPGHYRVVGYWGGNIATERGFEIVGASKGSKKKE